jgi:hypothetical protein
MIFLAWKVGMGTHVRVGVDSIMGCDRRVFLSNVLIHHLHLIGKATLNIVNKPMGYYTLGTWDG